MYLSTTVTASPNVIAEGLQIFLEVLITPSTTPRQYPASKPCVESLQYPASSFPSNLSGASSFTPKAANENNITKAIEHMVFIFVSFLSFYGVLLNPCRSVKSSPFHVTTAFQNVRRRYLPDNAIAVPTWTYG